MGAQDQEGRGQRGLPGTGSKGQRQGLAKEGRCQRENKGQKREREGEVRHEQRKEWGDGMADGERGRGGGDGGQMPRSGQVCNSP